jgi:phosphoglycerol transferase MdoB-like AlkP superfamily enzyme
VGAGEGYFLRFHPRKLEIHSSAATLLFSYGIVGAGLFLVFLRWLSVTAGSRLTLLMIPALSYSLFHQGMRARPFWLLLAVALGLGVLNAIQETRAPKEPALSLADR